LLSFFAAAFTLFKINFDLVLPLCEFSIVVFDIPSLKQLLTVTKRFGRLLVSHSPVVGFRTQSSFQGEDKTHGGCHSVGRKG